jgi:hypothetical protein
VIIARKASLFEEVVNQYSEKLQKNFNQPIFRFATVTSRRVQKESGIYIIHDDSSKHIIYAGRIRNLKGARVYYSNTGRATLEEANSERHWDKNTT